MAGQVKLTITETWTDLGDQEIQRKYSPTAISVTNGAEERQYSLATATKQTVWDPTNDGSEPGATFVYMRIVSDQNIHVLLVTDVGNDVGVVYKTHEVLAGYPFILSSDTSYANPSDNTFSGTADVTDQIRVWNNSGNTAKIRVLVGT